MRGNFNLKKSKSGNQRALIHEPNFFGFLLLGKYQHFSNTTQADQRFGLTIGDHANEQ